MDSLCWFCENAYGHCRWSERFEPVAGWGHPDTKDAFTDEEYSFWLNVRNTHAAINDKTVKSYTKEQMVKWYNGLHTDSAEYKMWGNGIALPPALYCMQGIKEALEDYDGQQAD